MPIETKNWDIAREGWLDAGDGEPLFPDAHPAYAAGWCFFHNCENPYPPTVAAATQGETKWI